MPELPTTTKPFYTKLVFALLVMLYIAFNAFMLVQNSFFALLLPFGFGLVLFSFQSFKRLYYTIIFFVPLSLELSKLIPLVSNNLSIPTEPFSALLMLVLLLHFLIQPQQYPFQVMKHPLSLAVAFYLFWIFVTAISSTMPVVSFKFWLAKIWFFVPFFFGSLFLIKNQNDVKRVFSLFIASLTVVAVYVLYKNIFLGLNNSSASLMAVGPFFRDHTSYAVVLALFFPYLVLNFIHHPKTKPKRIVKFLLVVVFGLAIVFSHSRAAWLSLVAAAGVYAIIRFRIRWQWLVMGGLMALFFLYINWFQIIDTLDNNKQDSGKDLASHVESMTNIATDASNLERINRWSSAWSMFLEKPVLGWGAGTFQFQYAPFQMAKHRTVISTNFGDWGNAHSEYLGALTETGVIGLVAVLLLLFFFFRTAIVAYYKASNKQTRMYLMAIILGLTSYFSHGVLNNYLDLDKAAIPVAVFLALAIVLSSEKNTNFYQKRPSIKKRSKRKCSG